MKRKDPKISLVPQFGGGKKTYERNLTREKISLIMNGRGNASIMMSYYMLFLHRTAMIPSILFLVLLCASCSSNAANKQTNKQKTGNYLVFAATEKRYEGLEREHVPVSAKEKTCQTSLDGCVEPQGVEAVCLPSAILLFQACRLHVCRGTDVFQFW